MKNIVLTTSSSGLESLNIKTDIELIRLRIFVNNIEFTDGKNIDIERLTQLMQKGTHSPVHTAPPTVEDIKALFSRLQTEGYKNVFITCLSSTISDSYTIIKEVAEDFKNSLNIHVYDCEDLNVCESMLALEAEYMLKNNRPFTEIVARLDTLRASHKVLYVVDDLSYLIKNKKISAASGFFAGLLDIKPVLTVTPEGRMEPVKKIRKVDKALVYIIDKMQYSVPRADSFAYVMSAGRDDIDEKFVTMVKKSTHVSRLPVLPVSAISLANHGPTGVALAVFEGQVPYAAQYFK